MNPNNPLPGELKVFAEQHLGRVTRAVFRGWQHAASSVWEVCTTQGARVFVKQHVAARKFAQERNAYTTWVTQLDNVPELLAVKEDVPRALLLSAVPGQLVQTAALSPQQLEHVYWQAGKTLGTIHALTVPAVDPLSLQAAMTARAGTWLGLAANYLTQADIDWVAQQVEALVPLLEGAERVPCHKDFETRNWLLDGDKLYLIDFEHAGLDYWLFDIQRLHDATFRFQPQLKAAFMAGYGRELSVQDEKILNLHGAFKALTTIVWASQHRDSEFEQLGWHRLEYYKRLDALNRCG